MRLSLSRTARLVVVLLLIGVIALLLEAQDRFGASWPKWVGTAWVLCIVAGSISCIFLFGTAVGLISDGLLASVGEDRAPTAMTWFAVYFGSLLVAILIAMILQGAYGIDPLRSMLVCVSLLFLAASSRRPWWLFATVRRTGWFAFIKSDRTMRWLLGAVGIWILLFVFLTDVSATYL